MATAACNNTDCEQDEWDLQKHPSEYARGVTCPKCGTTDVDVSSGGQPDGASIERARQDPTPARRGGGRGQAGVEDLFAVADDDVPNQQRAQSAERLLGTFGEIVRKYQEYQSHKQQAAERRAEQAELQSVDLPECPDCGYQFSPEEIGVAEKRVRCGGCDQLWEIDAPGM